MSSSKDYRIIMVVDNNILVVASVFLLWFPTMFIDSSSLAQEGRTLYHKLLWFIGIASRTVGLLLIIRAYFSAKVYEEMWAKEDAEASRNKTSESE